MGCVPTTESNNKTIVHPSQPKYDTQPQSAPSKQDADLKTTQREPSDEQLLLLLQQTSDAFENGTRENYMGGLQEMLKIAKAGSKTSTEPFANCWI